MDDEAKWRQPVGPAGQAAAGRGQHGRRDPEPSREELFIRLDWVLAIDATRADDRNPQSAIPEPVPHPADPHIAGHHDRRESRGLDKWIARLRHDPEPGQGQRPVPAPADAFVLRDPDEPGHGVVMEKDGAMAAPRRPGGPAQAPQQQQRARRRLTPVVVPLSQGGCAIAGFTRQACPPGSPSGG